MRISMIMAACAMFLAAIPAQAQDGSPAKIVVVSSKGRGAPNFAKPVSKLIERKLKVFGEVMPFRAYQRAARKKGIKRKSIAEISTAQALAPDLGLTHVVVIESLKEREKVGKRKTNAFYAEVTVVSAATGTVLHTQRFKLAGKRLKAPVADKIVQLIGGYVKATDVAPEEPVSEPEPEEPIAAAPPPPPPHADDPLAADDPAGEEGDPGAAKPAPAPESAAEPEATAWASPFEQPGVEEAVEEESEPEASNKGGQPWLVLTAGPTFLSRGASVSSSSDTVDYGGPLLGLSLNLGLFPLAFDGKGSAAEGIGIVARGMYSNVPTEFDPKNQPGATVDSTILSGDAGLAFRLALDDGADAASITFAVGYSVWQFPLSDGVFPGTKYNGIFAQVSGNIPVTDALAVVLDAGILPAMSTGGRTKRLGAEDSALGVNANVGVSFSLDPFVIQALGHFRQFAASYKGTTTLGLVDIGADELTDAELTDRYIGGSVLVGVEF